MSRPSAAELRAEDHQSDAVSRRGGALCRWSEPIDARHTDAWSAAKWVLDPCESTTISGWQVHDRTARRFYFTGENSSCGAALGKTENLGIIETVFFQERHREITVYAPRSKAQAAPEAQSAAPRSDDYAATGMGERTGHEVERVYIDLERQPVASVRIRYEFRPQLIKLGVFTQDPLNRRERARGFDRFCPELKWPWSAAASCRTPKLSATSPHQR